MTREPETLTLTPGRRYLVREGSWTVRLEEVRVVARSKTGVYVEHESGNRRWHPLASAGVGKWVIEEDLGPWNPHEARDEAAELRAENERMRKALDTVDSFLSHEYHRNGHRLTDKEWAADVLRQVEAITRRRLAGGEDQE